MKARLKKNNTSTVRMRFSELPLIINTQEPQNEIPLHFHEFEELVVIRRGTGIHFTQNESYRIKSGDVFIIKRGIAHGYRDMRSLFLTNILFLPEKMRFPKDEIKKIPGYHGLFLIEPEFRDKNKFGGRLLLSPEDLAHVMRLINLILNESLNKSAGFEFVSLAYFMELIAFLSRAYSKMEGNDYKPIIRLGEVMSYIEKHYREKTKISDLLNIAAMSRRNFFRIFKKTFACSPIEYIMNLRISHASKLLRDEGISIKEASFQSGFSDSNYFSRQFRKIIGESPSHIKNHAHKTRKDFSFR